MSDDVQNLVEELENKNEAEPILNDNKKPEEKRVSINFKLETSFLGGSFKRIYEK